MFMPWLTVSFIGQFSFSLYDVYSLISKAGQNIPSRGLQPASTLTSAALPLAAIILYPLALLLGLISIASRKAIIPASVLAISAGITWIVGVESLKASIVGQASQAGGVLGGAFASAAASLVTVGYGAYAVIFGGILIAVGYYASKPK